MFVNSGTRAIKLSYYARYLFPLSPFHKTRDTPSRVKQGGSKKSFGISNWHLLRKGEKLQRKKDRERILGLLSGVEGRAFLAKGVAKMYGRQAAEKRRFGEVFSKLDAKYFCLRKLFWDTPVYHV